MSAEIVPIAPFEAMIERIFIVTIRESLEPIEAPPPGAFVFPVAPRSRRNTYAQRIALSRVGMLSIGFIWEIAARDEVFHRYLTREGFPKP